MNTYPKEYDYLIVGSGLFGSICAYKLNEIGYKCLVIEKRNHIGGNCFTEKINDINVHKYGAHIFHTSNLETWDFINKFANFNHYKHHLKVNYRNKIYSFPINLFTLSQLYGIITPLEAKNKLEGIVLKIDNPSNLEEWILSKVGKEIYEIFIKGYTTKQWGTEPKNLPISIISRIPIRMVYNDNYYDDYYQGIPIGGYTPIFEKLLKGIPILLNKDYFDSREYFDRISRKIIYSGSIDKFYNYEFGKLEYRSSVFKEKEIDLSDFQGISVMNYTDIKIPYTRIIEHKHFEFGKQSHTIITKEYSIEGNGNNDFYYPINNNRNNQIFNNYKELTKKENRVIFGGRIADYKYYDMNQVIENSLKTIREEIKYE
jgi:UDP-galactopyranose mutase